MKQYSTPTRKPMMYGGETRKKREYGSSGRGEKRQKMSDRKEMEIRAGGKKITDAEFQAQVREDISKMSRAEIEAEANGTGMRASIARSILGRYSPGDQEPTE